MALTDKEIINDFENLFTSSIEILPPGPVPFTSFILIPISLAKRLTEGAAGAILSGKDFFIGTYLSVFLSSSSFLASSVSLD